MVLRNKSYKHNNVRKDIDIYILLFDLFDCFINVR